MQLSALIILKAKAGMCKVHYAAWNDLRPTWQEEKQDEDDAYEAMDSSGLQGLGLPTRFGAQKSSKVSSTLPY